MRVPRPPKLIGFNCCNEVVMVRLGKRFESNERAFKHGYVCKVHLLSLASLNIKMFFGVKAGYVPYDGPYAGPLSL